MGVCERHRQTGREPYIGRQIGGDLTQASFPLLIRQTHSWVPVCLSRPVVARRISITLHYAFLQVAVRTTLLSSLPHCRPSLRHRVLVLISSTSTLTRDTLSTGSTAQSRACVLASYRCCFLYFRV